MEAPTQSRGTVSPRPYDGGPAFPPPPPAVECCPRCSQPLPALDIPAGLGIRDVIREVLRQRPGLKSGAVALLALAHIRTGSKKPLANVQVSALEMVNDGALVRDEHGRLWLPGEDAALAERRGA